ncbi:MAG: hypothetical protein HYY55_02455 [Candidatus Niyogibacteria bacterium]|nr:MAG: hypothetical protein HYY55_02455 [Candidatus Niyogibacteria bacterium]
MLMKLFGSFTLLIFFIIFGPVNAQAAGFGISKYGEAGYGYGTTTGETSTVRMTSTSGTAGATTSVMATTSEMTLATTSEMATATTSEITLATTSEMATATTSVMATTSEISSPSIKPAAAPARIKDKKISPKNKTTSAPEPTIALISTEEEYSTSTKAVLKSQMPIKTLVVGIITNSLKIARRVIKYKLWQAGQFLFSIF